MSARTSVDEAASSQQKLASRVHAQKSDASFIFICSDMLNLTGRISMLAMAKSSGGILIGWLEQCLGHMSPWRQAW